MTKFYQGVAGKRGYNPKGIIIHNDAGSMVGTAQWYRNWLPTHPAESGFAHYYVSSDGTYQAELESNIAWHCANRIYNRDFIGIEACQSRGDEANFRRNEDNAFKLAAQICQRYGIQPNNQTIMLHKEVAATACPHRSVALHGQSNAAVKAFFIAKIKEYMGTKAPTVPTATVEKVLPVSVDGIGGVGTVKALQKYFGTPIDGVISGQTAYSKQFVPGFTTVQLGGGGSQMIAKLQVALGVEADGYIGSATVKALQGKLGVPADGYAGETTIKALQTRLNGWKLW